MKRTIITLFLSLLYLGVSAQGTIKGVVLDAETEAPIEHVFIAFELSTNSTKTDVNGKFSINNLQVGNHILKISLKGYETQKFQIQLSGKTIDLGVILLYKIVSDVTDLSVISLTDDELENESNAADNISGLLQASKDLFLRTAAFEFSSSFFKIRGLNSENATVIINGIEMNKIYSQRPQWSNWGGLNDVTRNQEFSAGLQPSSSNFGGLLGSTHIITRASKARAGTKISYASSNRSYLHRVMASYASGLLKNDWAFTIAISKRYGKEGYSDGTFYDANSFFTNIEKFLNKNHSLNFSFFYTPNKRGKSSSNTDEVYNLKGIKYNAYWGFQNGEKRNSRIKKVVEPLFILNHFWQPNSQWKIQTNVAFQFGMISNSRIDYTGHKIDGVSTIVRLGGANPDPTYYQKLPSYALKNDASNTFEIQQQFLKNGQLNWHELYAGNQNPFNDNNAKNIVYEDRNDDQQLTINSILETQITPNIALNGSIQYRKLKTNNYAKVVDLLGSKTYLDVDPYATTNSRKQNNLFNPNNLVTINDKFKYNYQLSATVLDGFLQTQLFYKQFEGYLSLQYQHGLYQRIGLFKNGKLSENNASFGASKKLDFKNVGFKTGGTFKLTGRHLFTLNSSYRTKAPKLKNMFTNVRVSNETVNNISNEQLLSLDLNYQFRSPILEAKISGFYTSIKNATEVSFYYADGIGGNENEDAAFVQEILSNINTQHIGLEFGISSQINSTLKLKAAGSIGQYTFDNNPTLDLRSESENFQFSQRLSHLKNYKLPVGPQQAISIGFEYRAPEYWWFGATYNFFDRIYIDVNPLTRTNNFSNDNGIPFNDYDAEIAKELLKQEKFSSYTTLNIVGGKTWKIKDTYLSLFVSISNLLNQQYKTGGFEQGRNANYRQLKEDKALDTPLFGAKYWYGRGASYFTNFTIRF